MSLIANQKSKQFIILFWLSFLFVLALNLLVWFYLTHVENHFQEQLKARLKSSNQVLSRLLLELTDEVNLNLIIPGQEQSIEYLFYQQTLQTVRLESNLQTILLLSPQGEIIASSPQILGSQLYSGIADRAEFKKALYGESVVSDIEQIAGERFASAFAPLRDIDGFTIGIVVIEARADYFSVLASLKNRMLVFSVLNFILILFIAYLLFRLLKRKIRYETEIRDKKHLVRLGTMGATVAHELRNPLNIIEATNDTIKKKYSRNNDEIFDFIPLEIKRLSLLIDDFLRFARTPQLNIEEINLSALTERIKLALKAEERSLLTIEPLPQIIFFSDPNLIEQALINIITNAVHAIQQKGTVRLAFKSEKKKNLLCIIEDNGTGIDPAKLDDIFLPFYSNKEKGTGLGLAITKRLVENLHGSIQLNSELEEGTNVTVKLPDLRKLSNYKATPNHKE